MSERLGGLPSNPKNPFNPQPGFPFPAQRRDSESGSEFGDNKYGRPEQLQSVNSSTNLGGTPGGIYRNDSFGMPSFWLIFVFLIYPM